MAMEPLEFVKAVFEFTVGPVFLTALPSAREIATRKLGDIARFIERNDIPGQDGVYFCPSALAPDAALALGERSLRSKRTASQAGVVWTDIDGKNILLTLEDAANGLRSLRFPPSFIVWSGNGIHAYWLLTEPFDVQSERNAFEGVLRLLADRFGGDPAPAHAAPLMRLPGTHNRKRGECKPVTVEGEGRRYHFEDLEEWLEEQPVAIERAVPIPRTADADLNPFLAAAREHGWKPTLNVKGELERMVIGNIHHTCVRVSASLLMRGDNAEDVTARLLGEIERVKLAAGEPFRARSEERKLLAMCRSWIAKHPVEHRRKRTMDEPSEVHEYDGARAKKKAKDGPGMSKEKTAALPPIVADGVIEALRRDGQDIMLADGSMWVYSDGVWALAEAGHEQRLRTLIQLGCDALERSHDSKIANAAWKRLNEHPGLYRPSVPWLTGPTMATQNGLLDITTRTFTPPRADAYARRKVGAAYDPAAKCPAFLGFLDSLFSDYDAATRPQMIGLIQEWFGAMFVPNLLYREERKALLLLGPSRTGKTELARIAKLLVGCPVASPSVSEISERFGLASFYGSTAWIRDDAVNEGDRLDPQRFKTIITGEPVDIERKGLPALRGIELNIPVLLTTNAMPRARDASDAIFNRAHVVEMNNVVSEEDARAVRLAVGVPRGQSLASWLFAMEGPGIFNWSLDGFDRLAERGRYDPPPPIAGANQRFKDENNPVAEFARTNVVKSSYGRVARHDLMCAYHGWQREQEGDEARAAGARWFFPRLRSAVPGLGEKQEHSGTRYLTGISLTDEGLQHWERHITGPQLRGGNKGFAVARTDVNKSWNPEEKHDAYPF